MGTMCWSFPELKMQKSDAPICASLFLIWFRSFLCEVDMIKDVLLTEAVVTGTFAAITELQIGVVGVRLTTDTALVMVAFLTLLLLYCFFELYRLTGVTILAALDAVVNFRPDEDEEVQKCQQGDNDAGELSGQQGGDHLDGKECAVQNGQPLHLYGNDEEEQHLRIGEHGGESQEHGEVHIAGAGIPY